MEKHAKQCRDNTEGNPAMTAQQSWNQIKTRYLSEIEKSLAHVDPAVCRRILSDVESHLDQRLSELADDQKTPEHFKDIVEDMGPAEDYARFLSNESPPSHPNA